ncbi:MAG TPA: ROK family protein [Acetobacteraceae bacterium]|jgi:fructokinase|nr:ROK family protein [Acetobacteraceae bacterium]
MDQILPRYDFRIGIDLGGTKVEAIALARNGEAALRQRIATPAGYDATIQGIADLVQECEQRLGGIGSVGVGIPGVISPVTGLVKNANSIALNGHAFDRDLAAALGRAVIVANDANCFALSEASDGAGAGKDVVFGVIIGTGCGGGVVVGGRVLTGRNSVTGEWGHIPLPWPKEDEQPGIHCWCGKYNCMETWISGTGLARDCDGPGHKDASHIPARAASGDAAAIAALDRHADRMARGLAVVVNVLDPDVVVLGGGLSNMDHLYVQLPQLLKQYVFSDFVDTPVVKNMHGDSSGVRGAAWLWPVPAG